METASTVRRYASIFFAGTFISRISGLLRDVAMAASFGSSAEVAAFFVAFRFANLFRRLLGEGNVQAGFIPLFSSMGEKGAYFYRDAVWSMGGILIACILGCEAFCWGLCFFVSEDWKLILELTMWMLPGLFFICLYGINAALLQVRKRYFLPAISPVAFNVMWIAAALFTSDVRVLSMAVTLGFVAQWLATFFKGASLLSWKEWLKPQIFSPECKQLLRSLSLGMVGVGAVQLNSTLDAVFARFADLSAPANLWYAIRIQQVPMALFGLSLTSALLPALTRTQGQEARNSLLMASLKQAAFLTLLSTLGLFALGEVGGRMLYGFGNVNVTDVVLCLWGYGAGLMPAVFVLLLASRYHAEQDYKTPAMASVGSILINMALNALFVFGFGWGGFSIALSTSISSLFNLAFLLNKNFITYNKIV